MESVTYTYYFGSLGSMVLTLPGFLPNKLHSLLPHQKSRSNLFTFNILQLMKQSYLFGLLQAFKNHPPHFLTNLLLGICMYTGVAAQNQAVDR